MRTSDSFVQTFCGGPLSSPNLLWGPLILLSKLSMRPTVLSKTTVGPAESLIQIYCWTTESFVQTFCEAHCLVQTYGGAHWRSSPNVMWGSLTCPNLLWAPQSLLSKLNVWPTDSLVQTFSGPTVLSKPTVGPTDCPVQTYCAAHRVSYPNLLCGPQSLSATHLQAVPKVTKV